jgi:two-component system, LuxR family, sensor kinase FixL
MHKFGKALLFSLVLIAVDKLSYIHPIGHLNITPWNPPAALDVLFLYWAGSAWMAWLYVTLGLADVLVRDISFFTPAVVLGNAVLVACYASIAFCFRYLLKKRSHIHERNQLLKLGAVLVLGAATTAVTYVTTQSLIGGIPKESVWEAVHRFFIGDLLGFFVVLPLIFVATNKRRRPQYVEMFSSGMFWFLIALLVACLWFVFSLPIENQMKYFFTLFFVLSLLAATYSLPGATFAAATVQLPLVFSTSGLGASPSVLMDLQIVMLTLSLTGLIIGLVVDERMQAEQKLRDSLQLIAAGELAGSLAHELHQPMSALSAYSESAMMLLSDVDADIEKRQRARDILKKVVAETLRASEIVRGLRGYFIGGASNLQQASTMKIIDDCVGRLHQLTLSAGVRVEKIYDHKNDVVLVDLVQISTAIGNLLKNAIDASQREMLVTVRVSDHGAHSLSIQVIDEGEPISEEIVDQVFRPFYTQKKDGLGLGLSVSKSLVENNGGLLRYVDAPYKCFEIILPSEKAES